MGMDRAGSAQSPDCFKFFAGSCDFQPQSSYSWRGKQHLHRKTECVLMMQGIREQDAAQSPVGIYDAGWNPIEGPLLCIHDCNRFSLVANDHDSGPPPLGERG